MSKLLKIVFGTVIVIIALFWYVTSIPASKEFVTVKDFATCESLGYPIMESFPRQCRTLEGTVYVEEIKEPIQIATTSIATSTATTTPSTTTESQSQQ